MARAGKLKVYRTAIGFHDAYVAASNQKTALEAWGSDKDLFARGVAEIVTDAALTEEPLASPGKVIKRLRGTADEQIAAFPADKPRAAEAKVNAKPPADRASRPRKPKPPPSRAHLEKAETALEDMLALERKELAELRKREAALAEERKRLLTRHEHDKQQRIEARDQAAQDYDRAFRQWRAT